MTDRILKLNHSTIKIIVYQRFYGPALLLLEKREVLSGQQFDCLQVQFWTLERGHAVLSENLKN